MNIQTTRFGELEVPDDDIITFPEGLLGFANHKRYVLLDSEELDPLKWLQSVDAKELAFVILDPRLALTSYDLHISRECALSLNLCSANEASVFAIITADPDPTKSTINLQAPIIINTRSCLAKQIILLDQQYSIRYPLMPRSSERTSTAQQNAVAAR